MTKEDLIGLTVTDQYGREVVITEILGNIAITRTISGITRYHTAKLFHDGRNVLDILKYSNE